MTFEYSDGKAYVLLWVEGLGDELEIRLDCDDLLKWIAEYLPQQTKELKPEEEAAGLASKFEEYAIKMRQIEKELRERPDDEKEI